MIIQAVQQTLAAVLTSYSKIAPQSAELPFCVHAETGIPIRTKAGITGYTYKVNIVLVAATNTQLGTNTESIIAAVEDMEGQTIKSTEIEAVDFESDDPDYDEASEVFINTISFTIETNNR